MNFFEHQDRARRATHWLILFFILGVAAIAAAVSLVTLIFLGEPPAQPEPDWGEWLRANGALLGGTVLAVVGAIGLASGYRVASLAEGGSKVAEMLGGTRVTPDSRDPLRRRLLNTVEEVALASGTPVPDVYILEQEPGINAFAAGYGPGDAAVAVTRGTLEKLDRDELQGVVAHEFAHIANGDMRLNIRLMGVLFGLLVLTVAGRFMVRALYFGGRNREGAQAAMAVAALGLALLVIGGLGVFFGRLIKAAVSRRREYLADASAVQFTRNPDGIGGALKKIALHSHGSALESPETEEVSHMLIASGFTSMSGLLSTHPPLVDRIRAIEPGFDPERDLQALADAEARRQRREARRAAAEEKKAEEERDAGGVRLPGTGPLPGTGALPEGAILGAILADVDHPDTARRDAAAALARSLPPALDDAVHGDHAHLAVLFTLLCGEEDEVREAQLRIVADAWGDDARAVLEEWLAAEWTLAPAQRLPLLELALPALRHQPRERLHALRETLQRLIAADGRISVFEFALTQLFDAHLRDVLHPGGAGNGRAKLNAEKVAGIQLLLAVTAHAGAGDDQEAAAAAYAAGIAHLYRRNTPPAYRGIPVDWPAALTAALPRLDRLAPEPKRLLLQAVLATISHSGRVNTAEAELLRAFAASLHVPVPLILPADLTAD